MPNPALGDTEKMSYAVSELDADSNPATPQPGDVVQVVSSDTDSATIVPDATPQAGFIASGFIVGGRKVQQGVTITFTPLRADGQTPIGPPVVDTIDVVGGAASSIAVSLGTPVAQ